MQAQIMRLDAFGERVTGLAGVKPEEFNVKQETGRGGAEPTSLDADHQPHDLIMIELQKALKSLSRDIDYSTDYMNVADNVLMSDKIKFQLLSANQPVNVSYNSSSFGWLLYPFSSRSAFHEGLDFPAFGRHRDRGCRRIPSAVR